MVELRIDGFEEDPLTILGHSGLPVILTCRASYEGGREGGQSDNSDTARLAALVRLADHASYIDVELEAIDALPSPVPTRLIISAHDFSGRPQRLYNVIQAMNASQSDVNKVVWLARSIRDNIEA